MRKALRAKQQRRPEGEDEQASASFITVKTSVDMLAGSAFAVGFDVHSVSRPRLTLAPCRGYYLIAAPQCQWILVKDEADLRSARPLREGGAIAGLGHGSKSPV